MLKGSLPMRLRLHLSSVKLQIGGFVEFKTLFLISSNGDLGWNSNQSNTFLERGTTKGVS